MLKYRGFNLAGGDTFFRQWQQTLGPVDQQNYRFVTKTDVDYLTDKGANCFRLLLSWEALQCDGKRELGSGGSNYAKYWAKAQETVDYITNVKHAGVVLDLHGGDKATFGAYRGVRIPDLYYGVSVSELLADLWGKVGKVYKDNHRVMYGLMNEPFNMPTQAWYATAKLCETEIRKAGANGMIVRPGNYFTGAGTFCETSMFDTGAVKIPNSAIAPAGYADSANNTVNQVHMYLDRDQGGGAPDIVSADIGVQRMKKVTEWARQRERKLFLTEIGFSAANPLAKEAARNLFDYMQDNDDVWLGWLWWAYGPPSWWGGYQFTACPTNNYTQDSAQMSLIKAYLQ